MKTAMDEENELYPEEWEQDHAGCGGGPSILSDEELTKYIEDKTKVLRRSMELLKGANQ